MPAHPELRDMEDVRALLAAADPHGRLVPCGLRDVRLGSGAAAGVAAAVAELLPPLETGDGGTVLLLVDETPILREGADLKDLVEAQLRDSFRVRKEVLSDGHAELHVSEPVVEAASRAARGADAVVALGGGTISDIGKLAAEQAGVPALVVVQTAASVDGYTDNVSVVLRDGVKRTVPSRWPDIVITDVETIAAAPPRMNTAGYGEMTSMFVAPADWRLAYLLGSDESFSQGPIELLGAVGQDLAEWSPGVGRGDVEAVERLAWALAVRGVATGVAGTTACLSGVEHLISHMLDLHHGDRGLPMGLHGAQVGVGSVVAAAAWELLFERIAETGEVRLDAAAFHDATARTRIEAAFGHLNRGEKIVAECWKDYSRKIDGFRARLDRVNSVLRDWSEHEQGLRRLVRPSTQIAAGLRAAGTAVTFAELDPQVDLSLARWAVQNCALMRNRTTVVDLLAFLGWWDAEDVTAVLQRAAHAVPVATEVSHVG